MKKRMLRLALALLAGSPLLTAAQQPSRPMPTQNQSAVTCPMGMHGMMMGAMGEGMMRPGQRPMAGAMGGQMGPMMNDSAMMAQMRSQLGLTDAQVQQLRAIHQRAMIDMCNALTPAQRQKLDQMHQQMMQGGMRPG